jgi:hypothetical protein
MRAPAHCIVHAKLAGIKDPFYVAINEDQLSSVNVSFDQINEQSCEICRRLAATYSAARHVVRG